MADAKKDRKRLTDLSQPLQMAEFNRQMDWIWSQLMGNLPEKALSGEVRNTIADANGNASEALQTAQGLSTRVTNAENDASEALQTASGLSTRVTTADGKASQALQTANGFSARITNAEGDIAFLELSLSGVVASVEGNRLVFDSNGLTIKNAAGETVFFSSAITGTLNITGNINAAGGTIGGFTIGDNSITAPNGVKLYSSGNFSTVNNLQLSSGTDGHHRNYAMLTQASGFDELRIMHSSGDAEWGSVRFYAENGQAKVSVHSPLTIGEGLLLINLPTTTQQPNLYIDAAGNLYRCTQ